MQQDREIAYSGQVSGGAWLNLVYKRELIKNHVGGSKGATISFMPKVCGPN